MQAWNSYVKDGYYKKIPATPGYPGLGLPLRHNLQDADALYPLGAHSSCRGGDSDILPVRELAMMSIMEKLTDKEDWHKKVFDEEIVSKWREEALSIPDTELWNLAVNAKTQAFDSDTNEVTLHDDDFYGVEPLEGIMTRTTFDCCVSELRSKAKYYEESGLIPTLDACASVVKSDKLVSPELREALRNAFNKLKADQTSSPDFHPNTKEKVQDLVHPSLYPLVYGRSRVLKDEVVGVKEAVEKWAGKGDVIPKELSDPEADGGYRGYGVPPSYWSLTYQWLPANVAFQADGTVKFTSYINNLHPNRYPDIYRTIEKLIGAALPAWDQCLANYKGYNTQKEGAGRLEPRFPRPGNPDDDNGENWVPSDPKDVAHLQINWDEVSEYDRDDYQDCDRDDEEGRADCKWRMLRKPNIPEPCFNDVEYAPKPGQRLVDKFRDFGLQVIVKMASIELTPDEPEFPVGGWHVEGQMNEHICGTALYYLDSENITSSSLSFRMQTSSYLNDEDKYNVGQEAYHWMEQIYGTNLGGNCSPCLQNYGTVETREGRLLAFPNVFQHRVSPFRLIDPTKPGHRRFIALWLVDPHKRIISTANVPPQQHTWWTEAVFGSDPESRQSALDKLPADLVSLLQERGLDLNLNSKEGKIPPELMQIVREYLNADSDMGPMTLEEAKEHRIKLMNERSRFHRATDREWKGATYSFCEH